MNLVAVDYQADNAAELFAKSLHETGFGVLKNFFFNYNVL